MMEEILKEIAIGVALAVEAVAVLVIGGGGSRLHLGSLVIAAQQCDFFPLRGLAQSI